MKIDREEKATQVVKHILMMKGMKQKELAPLIGKSPAALCTQLNAGYIKADEWREMLLALGYEIELVPIAKDPE